MLSSKIAARAKLENLRRGVKGGRSRGVTGGGVPPSVQILRFLFLRTLSNSHLAYDLRDWNTKN